MVESSLIQAAAEAISLRATALDALRESIRKALRSAGHSGVLVGISGGGTVGSSTQSLAEQLGEELARRGAAVVTGGLGGVMAAASKGAKQVDGLTIGVLPGTDPQKANPYIDIPIATGWEEGRNFLLSFLSDGLIAVDGEYGTLSEIALARKLGRPVVGLRLTDWHLSDVVHVQSPTEAADRLWAQLGGDVG